MSETATRDEAREEAIDRFTELLRMSHEDAEHLVESATQAAADQVLETIKGSEAIPSTMIAAKADELRYVCLNEDRILSQREVEVLFRVTPTNARSILRTMSATYAKQLDSQFVSDMRREAQVSAAGTEDRGLTWKVSFTDDAPYATIRRQLRRLDLDGHVTFRDNLRTVEFPRWMEMEGRGSISILQTLEIEEPT